MTIEKVPFGEILECRDLLAEYAAECSIPAIGPICPQADIYSAMERAGIMQCFAVVIEGQVVGFANVLTTVLPHYGRKVATIESLFIEKAHRSHGSGTQLMDRVREFARETGCRGTLHSAPAGGRLEMLLDSQKRYRRTNAVFYEDLS